MLWAGPRPTNKTVLLNESKEVTAGTIVARDTKIVWRSADGVEQLVTPSGVDGATFKLALALPEHVEVRDVRIEVRQAFVAGGLIGETALLVAVAKPVDQEIAYVVSKETLNPEVITGLSVGLLGDPRIPAVYRELVNSLPFLELGAAIGRAGVYSLESQVFLKADGTQAFTSALIPNEQSAVTSVRQRMELLAKVSLVLQLHGPEGTLFVRAKPDGLWLTAQLGVLAAGDGVLRMPIHLASVVASDGTDTESNVLPAEYAYRIANYEQVTTGGSDMHVLAKIALTPLAVAADVAVGLLIAWLVLSLDDEDDDEKDQLQFAADNRLLGGVMTRARDRRQDESEEPSRGRATGRQL
ncbi:MAG: hypothetical protein ACI9S9_002002 [Planctomycetota bacterium]|jgi:hypothetical protein